MPCGASGGYLLTFGTPLQSGNPGIFTIPIPGICCLRSSIQLLAPQGLCRQIANCCRCHSTYGWENLPTALSGFSSVEERLSTSETLILFDSQQTCWYELTGGQYPVGFTVKRIVEIGASFLVKDHKIITYESRIRPISPLSPPHN